MGNKKNAKSDGADALTVARGRAIAAIAKAAAKMAQSYAVVRAAPSDEAPKVTRLDCKRVAENWGEELVTDLIRAAMIKDPERIGLIVYRWAPRKKAEPAPSGGTAAELLARLSAAAKN